MGKVIILIDDKFEDAEAIYPYYRLQEAGHKVVVVGAKAETYHGKHGYPLKADMTPREVSLDGAVAVIIPGGQAPDKMRTNPAMVEIVRNAMDKGLVVGAICHGPQMLIEADIVRGKKATCYRAVKTDLINAGALFEDAPVVVDGNIVTSRIPADLPDFCRAIIKLL